MLYKSANPDFGQSKVNWVGHSGVESKNRGIRLLVRDHILLPKTVVSDVHLIRKSRIRCPYPSSAQNLSPRVGLRKKERVCHGRIFLGLNAIPNKISSNQHAFIGKVIVQL